VELGPRALHWGPTQISYCPTWRSTWHEFGAKILGLSKNDGPRFSLPQFQNLGPNDYSEPPPSDAIHLHR
jgi:hypothetical protein